MLAPSLASTPEVAVAVTEYCNGLCAPLPRRVLDHQNYTAANVSNPNMMISTLEAKTLSWIARDRKAKRILEIGCFSGFSALVWAECVPSSGGEVISLEIDKEMIAMANKAIREQDMQDMITVIPGPAAETLQTLEGEFDLIFLDADKAGYITYFETILARKLLAPNGVILADNTLYSGLVCIRNEHNPARHETTSVAVSDYLIAFNKHVAEDSRVDQIILPLFDGLSMIRLIS